MYVITRGLKMPWLGFLCVVYRHRRLWHRQYVQANAVTSLIKETLEQQLGASEATVSASPGSQGRS